MKLPGLLLLACACAPAPGAPKASAPAPSSEYLYVWTGSADSTAPDFLAVLDVRPDTGRYGALVSTLPVPGLGNHPHHTEHQLYSADRLFANGFASGQSFIFDVRDAGHPLLAGGFGELDGYSHPHSFLRLAGGNVLATYQMHHDASGMGPGGLAELTPDGKLVRSSSANGPGIAAGLRPYSGAIVPALDRIVTTTTDMDEKSPYPANQLQIWRLSNLELLHTITLPQGSGGDEGNLTAEPRLLPDGRTVLVSTFDCGLYLLDGLDGADPSGRLVASLPRSKDTYCAIPVVSGHYLVITVPSIPGVVSLDIANPAAPHEASRVTLRPGDIPHWIAMEPNAQRVVLTGYGKLLNRVLMLSFDSTTGALALDGRFREAGADAAGFLMSGKTWPHGGTGAGLPHGAVFSLPK